MSSRLNCSTVSGLGSPVWGPKARIDGIALAKVMLKNLDFEIERRAWRRRIGQLKIGVEIRSSIEQTRGMAATREFIY
jgi:hypothetical protein